MPDDLHLIVIAASGMSRGRLYGVGSEAVALRGLLPCCADVGEKWCGGWRLLFSMSPLSSTSTWSDFLSRIISSTLLFSTDDEPRQSCYSCRHSLDIFINYSKSRVRGPWPWGANSIFLYSSSLSLPLPLPPPPFLLMPPAVALLSLTPLMMPLQSYSDVIRSNDVWYIYILCLLMFYIWILVFECFMSFVFYV